MSLHNKGPQDAQTSKLFQKRWFQALSGSLLVGTIFLFTTNPDQPAYNAYAAEQLPKHLKATNCDELEGNIGFLGLRIPTKDLCKSFVNGTDSFGRGAIKQIVDYSTERQNIYVCSIYTTRVFGREVKTLGIGKQFLTLP